MIRVLLKALVKSLRRRAVADSQFKGNFPSQSSPVAFSESRPQESAAVQSSRATLKKDITHANTHTLTPTHSCSIAASLQNCTTTSSLSYGEV